MKFIRFLIYLIYNIPVFIKESYRLMLEDQEEETAQVQTTIVFTCQHCEQETAIPSGWTFISEDLEALICYCPACDENSRVEVPPMIRTGLARAGVAIEMEDVPDTIEELMP